MRPSTRPTRSRRWLTFAVILGTLCASDARASHLASCTRAVDLCRPADGPAAGSPSCCPRPETGEATPVAADEDCLVVDDCTCCSHAPRGHLGEVDSRLLAESSDSVLDLDLASFVFLIEPIVPPTTVRVTVPAGHPLPASRIFLVLGRLLF